MDSNLSEGIPTPVSFTCIYTFSPQSFIFTNICPPGLVNFIEFESKFKIILSILSVSTAIIFPPHLYQI